MNIDKKDIDLLIAGAENGIINLAYVQEQFEMNKRKELLEKHQYKIWQGKDGKWRTYLPDKKKGRILKNRKSKKDLEDDVIAFYSREENESDDMDYRFKSVFAVWKERKKSYGVSDNTLDKYEKDFIRFFEGTDFEERDIKSVDEDIITAFMVGRVQQLHLKEKAGKALWGYIFGVFKFAKQKKLIQDNPCDYIETRQFSKFYSREHKTAEQRIISNDDLGLLMTQLNKSYSDNPDYIQSYAVELAIYTGMRVGELSGLMWRDIDEKSGVITICRSEKYNRLKKTYSVTSTKTGMERQYPITSKIRQLLNKVKIIEFKYGYFGEYVFQNESGRIHAKSIGDCASRKSKQVGIKSLSIHALRRTLNSKLRCEGVSAVVAASLLGHSEEVNDNNYTYDTTQMGYKAAIIEQVNNAI